MKKLILVLSFLLFPLFGFSFSILKAEGVIGENNQFKGDDVSLNIFAKLNLMSDWGLYYNGRFGYFPTENIERITENQFYNSVGYNIIGQINKNIGIIVKSEAAYWYFYNKTPESFFDVHAGGGLWLKIDGLIDDFKLMAEIHEEIHSGYDKLTPYYSSSIQSDSFYFSKTSFYRIILDFTAQRDIDYLKEYHFWRLYGGAQVEIGVNDKFNIFGGFRILHFIDATEGDYYPVTHKLFGIGYKENQDISAVIQFMAKDIYKPEKHDIEYFIELFFIVKFR